MPNWHWHTAKLSDPTITGEIDLEGVVYGQQENAAGEFNASTRLGWDDTVTELEALRRIPQGQSVIYGECDGVLVTDAVVWKHDYSSAQGALPIVGASLLSYLDHRHVTVSKTLSMRADLLLARMVAMAAQGGAGFELDTSVAPRAASAGLTWPVRQDTFDKAAGRSVLEHLLAFATTGNGFEVDVACARTPNSNTVRRFLRAGYPTLGVQESEVVAPRVTLSFVRAGYELHGAIGNVDTVSAPRDGTVIGNRAYAATIRADGATGVERAERALRDGEARLDTYAFYNDTKQTTLKEFAARDLAEADKEEPDLVMTVTYGEDAKGGPDLVPGRWSLYDEVLVRLVDPLRWPQTAITPIEFIGRIVGARVTVDEDKATFTIRPVRTRTGGKVDLS